jgi:hypothetical protein
MIMRAAVTFADTIPSGSDETASTKVAGVAASSTAEISVAYS